MVVTPPVETFDLADRSLRGMALAAAAVDGLDGVFSVEDEKRSLAATMLWQTLVERRLAEAQGRLVVLPAAAVRDLALRTPQRDGGVRERDPALVDVTRMDLRLVESPPLLDYVARALAARGLQPHEVERVRRELSAAAGAVIPLRRSPAAPRRALLGRPVLPEWQQRRACEA